MNVKTVVAAVALAAASQAAIAAPIVGNIGFSDGFSNVSSASNAVVSDLVNINLTSPQLAQGCLGNFTTTPGTCVPNIGTFAMNYLLNNPIAPQTLFSYNATGIGLFQFTVTSLIGGINRDPLVCNSGTCTDHLVFNASGTVAAPGFDPTVFTMGWNATGTCQQNGALAACLPNTSSGTWSASIAATGRSTTVPEPGTVSLIGLSLGLFGWAMRRRSRG